MDKTEFANIRKKLNKTQKELSNLLGISLKTVQAYEQGWRAIPAHAERQILFFAALKNRKGRKNCWEIKNCPPAQKANCPAWQFRVGKLCWFINGTICRGKIHKNWKEKIKFCRQCDVFKAQML